MIYYIMDNILLGVVNLIIFYVLYVIMRNPKNNVYNVYNGTIFVGLYVVIAISGLLLYYKFTRK